jgi:hypothetical protein
MEMVKAKEPVLTIKEAINQLAKTRKFGPKKIITGPHAKYRLTGAHLPLDGETYEGYKARYLDYFSG